MSIIPDLRLVLLQIVPFLVLIAGLHNILFKPMLKYLHDRDHATAGAKKEAHQLAAQAEARLAEYEKALEAARAEVAEYRAERRAEAQKAAAAKVAAVKQQVDGRVAAALATISAETEAARSQLGSHAAQLAQDAASQVLGRPLSAGVEASA